MKKASTALVIITIIFLAFLMGLFLGRNMDNTDIQISHPNPKEPAATTVPSKSDSSENPLPEKININTASADELSTLPGIGAVLAQRICDYRAEHGPFQTLHQLTDVEDIGQKRLEDILDYITLE